MKMYIPSVGEFFRLTEDWTFPCFVHLNQAFIEAQRPGTNPYKQHDPDSSLAITLPADTVLRVDRIYIRKGKKDYDSITFVVSDHPKLGNKGSIGTKRFWAKLVDVNEIVFEPCEKPSGKKCKTKK